MTDKILVLGRVGTGPTLKKLDNGTIVCNFSVATNERKKDKDQDSWQDAHTNWYEVSTFGRTAENANESLSKGDLVIIWGKLRIKPWSKDNKSGKNIDLVADEIGHNLRWGVSNFSKSQKFGNSDVSSDEITDTGAGDWHQIGDEMQASESQSWDRAPF